ncbi:MAG: plastocyanin/azurin family copper-binding protein [Chloroflexota bacterium]
MKKFNVFFVLSIGLVALILAACGGSEPAAPAEPDPVSFTFIGTDDFKWDPESITVESGAEVTIVLDNQGALEHNWILARDGIEVETASDADALFGANAGYVQGGETGEVTFFAPGPGNYLFVCTVAGHAAGGMVGEFVVEG